VSRVVLLAMFWVVFTPAALLFKLIGRDALLLRPHPEQDTYFRPKPARNVRSYFRQS
jgi:hypothetical protein